MPVTFLAVKLFEVLGPDLFDKLSPPPLSLRPRLHPSLPCPKEQGSLSLGASAGKTNTAARFCHHTGDLDS
ncbi:hypothetical protein ABVT39_016251 [Epinephelus coioides]